VWIRKQPQQTLIPDPDLSIRITGDASRFVGKAGAPVTLSSRLTCLGRLRYHYAAGTTCVCIGLKLWPVFFSRHLLR
jgi:hypothetical protein